MLHAMQQRLRPSAKIYAALPSAAKLYERQIEKGLDGNPEEAARGRQILRELCGGAITLTPTPKGLIARSALHRNVLIRGRYNPDGSGGRIRTLLARLPRRSFPSKTSAAIAALARWRRRA
jgi:hypothetical protein